MWGLSMSVEDTVEDWEWLDEGEDYGYPVGVLCIACMWDYEPESCSACANTRREPIPFTEMWGNYE